MIGWLAERLKPKEGWYTFLPLLITVLCLPAAIIDTEWIPGSEGLLPIAFFALLMGRWLALQENWGLGVWLLLSAPYGLLGALGVAARVLPLPPWGNRAVSNFAMRWLIWLEAAVSGGTNEDPDIFLFYLVLLCWMVVLFIAWAFYRRQRLLLAWALTIILTALVVFYSRQNIGWLIAELGCGILLLGLGNLARARRTWDAAGIDYAPGLNLDVSIVTGGIAFVITLFSLFGPQFSVRRIYNWFWSTFEGPSARVEEAMDRLFGGVSLSSEGPIGVDGRSASSYMPQSHLLGGRPELFDDVVMAVRTDEPAPFAPMAETHIPERNVPVHYWRGITLGKYSGRGWSTIVASREDVVGELAVPIPPDYREVVQGFELTSYHGDTLYTLNAPMWVGEPVEAVWHSPDDLARLASEVSSYTVVSRLPIPTANDLRAVPAIYSNEIRERYLQLPETVPTRVIDLAQDVVVEGETVYDQARLLERYLRGYPYTLEVERPPEGWDVADYFLFGIREGYCDYYATAFVVMARAAGIPARLASGYVEGQYDAASSAYLVRENDAHSWAEVYFSDWGWIRFEPTASRSVTELQEEVVLSEIEVLEPTGLPARVIRARWQKVGTWLAVLVGVWLVVMTWQYYRRRRTARVITLPLVWEWVGRGGARLGVIPDMALTPQEYAAALAEELHARAERSRRGRDRWMRFAERDGMALEHLAEMYTMRTYGGRGAEMMDEGTAREAWARLNWSLRWFRWLGWGQWKK
ncbi:MAG: transglutaminase domain-containing protein [Chloroflexi bacterium]|nr:transglutaminase domain-containing protein [Chloroflexota bacterium]